MVDPRGIGVALSGPLLTDVRSPGFGWPFGACIAEKNLILDGVDILDEFAEDEGLSFLQITALGQMNGILASLASSAFSAEDLVDNLWKIELTSERRSNICCSPRFL